MRATSLRSTVGTVRRSVRTALIASGRQVLTLTVQMLSAVPKRLTRATTTARAAAATLSSLMAGLLEAARRVAREFQSRRRVDPESQPLTNSITPLAPPVVAA